MKKAFSLVELSIVLAIIAILTAGVSSGSKLIRQAKLNKLIAEFTNLAVAIKDFETAYGQLPGDITNAHDYWGANCDATASKCNGNGDAKIDYVDAGTDDIETFRALQHLHLGEFTSFDASGTASSGFGTIGTNTMPSSFTNSGFTIVYDNQSYGSDYRLENVIYYGAATTTASSGDLTKIAKNSILTPSDARKIDRKLDDGQPKQGKLWGALGWNNSSWDSCRDSDTAYNLDLTSPACAISYIFN